MPTVTSKNLQIRLLILVVLAFLPALGFYWYANGALRDLQVEAKEKDLLQRVTMVTSEYRNLTEEANAFLGTLSEVPAVRDAQFPGCTETLRNIMDHVPNYTTISVIGVDGYLTCGSLTPEGDLYLGDRAYFVRANAVRSFAVGEFALGRITGEAVLGMAYPVIQEGSISRTLAVSLDLDVLSQSWAREAVPEDYSFTVLDGHQRVMVRGPRPDDFTLADSVGAMAETDFPGMPEGREPRIAVGTDLDGMERVFAVAPLVGVSGSPQGYVAIGRTRATLLEEVEEVSRFQLQYLAVGAVALLILAWVLGHFWLVRRAEPTQEA